VERFRRNWVVLVVLALAVLLVFILLGSLNVLVYTGPLAVGVTPTVRWFSGKLWVVVLLPFVAGLLVGLFLGLRVRRGPARP
jgi:H+/Cl- antiporter ClcA